MRAKIIAQKFPHTLTSRPRDRTKRKNYSRADYTRQRESLSIACNADLRLTSPFVPPLSPLLYTRINARAWARQARNTHARTGLDYTRARATHDDLDEHTVRTGGEGKRNVVGRW